jgi:hypothetical protein
MNTGSPMVLLSQPNQTRPFATQVTKFILDK